MLAALISLAVVGILLLVLYVRDRGKRASPDEVKISLNPQKFDTTLGEFHDMRQAPSTAAAHTSCFPTGAWSADISSIACREPEVHPNLAAVSRP